MQRVRKESPVVLVEDREEDILLARIAFGRAGVEQPLVVLREGSEAVDYLFGVGRFADRSLFPWPALVLLDLKMPGLDGFGVLEEWQTQGGPFVPIIVVSSSGLCVDIQRSRELGAVGYFIKPMELGDFVRFMQRLRTTWLGSVPVVGSGENAERAFLLYD